MPAPEKYVSRRRLLQYGALAGTVALAGCSGGEDESTTDDPGTDVELSEPSTYDGEEPPSFPEVEDPPEAVYKPSHHEGMVHLDAVSADGVRFGPMISYPHQFWTVTGTDVQKVEPTAKQDIHLMVTAWDEETGIVLPVDSGVSYDIYRDGEHVGTNNPWLMISQQMGFHFGDNVPLAGDGQYRIEGEMAPLTIDRYGSFAGRFEETLTFEFEFTFDDELRRSTTDGVEYLDESEWGKPGALEPMGGMGGGDMEGMDGHGMMPYSSVPPASELPGTVQGVPSSGDADLATVLLGPESRLGDGKYYLAVSPRTPYNRSVLPLLSLDAVHERDGEQLNKYTLQESLDHDLNHHYAVRLPDVQAGDAVTLDVVAPPQVARHIGYETAFLDMPSVTVELDA